MTSTGPEPVRIGSANGVAGMSLPTDLEGALAFAVNDAQRFPFPGSGRTAELWSALATIASHDLAAARAIEPHLDAQAILDQAGVATDWNDGGLWGVFAAEGGDEPLTAHRTSDGWHLTGVKPWCSLADRVDHALITAHLPEGGRSLFAIATHDPGFTTLSGTWHARGLAEIPSGPVRLTDVAATPIGAPGWYGKRPGFAWGGIGVAACWYGGLVASARAVFDAVEAHPTPLSLMQKGAIDVSLESSRRALTEAAELVDAGQAIELRGSILAARVRGIVARAADDVLARSSRVLGPASLALDEAQAKRSADLQVYVRQHHGERDDASLGEKLVAAGRPW
jgi:alkylation response protein AidB-like acyl-CoA dehydrogenase